ncbi:MAG TPA: PLDc N-terminal domain-containing protein [Cyclobacteriaceae bacterium]|nr:PLDc N-terminal domain-containing protein [Cyclobacteriaceae bacterium]
MFRLLSILVFVVDVIIVMEILRSNKDNEKKLLWIILVVFLPVLGPVLYFVIGRN